jgi:hypothetical protein
MTPVQQWQQCQGNKEDDTSPTTAKKPAQQQWHHCNNGINAALLHEER